MNNWFLVTKCIVFTTYIIKDIFYIIYLSYERNLLDAEFCTGSPPPIEHMRCGLKMGERMTLPPIGWVLLILPDERVGLGKFLTTSIIDANCERSLKFCVYIFL